MAEQAGLGFDPKQVAGNGAGWVAQALQRGRRHGAQLRRRF
ncbi:hypothetical protein D8I24_7199 [Cupriavidus necator H850]|nr:hypothetical protein D8I24_7199 [Cupriavidus necator H850]